MDNHLSKNHLATSSLSFSRAMKEVGRNSYIDWLMIISITVIVIVVLAIGSTYLYFAVTQGRIQYTVSTSSGDAISFDSKVLAETIKIFDAKASKSEQATRGFSGITDPSQ